MKHLMRTSILAASLTLCAASAAMALYPDRTVQIIAPYPAGGAADVMARVFSKELEAKLGQPFIVVNKPGGGTVVGAQSTIAAEPDGYTILLSSNSTYTLNPAINPKLPYDPVNQFEPIALVGTLALALMTQADSPLDSVAKVVAAAKADPKKLFYASFGNGTTPHFAGEMFKAAAGVEITHVPYRGSAPAMTDLMAGVVPLSFDTVVAAQPQVKAGKIKVLAVTTPRRSSLMPDVPTFAELGYPDYDMTSWIALVGPKGLSADAKAKLRATLEVILKDPAVRERLATLGFEPTYAPLDDWTRYVAKDIERMRAVATRAQMRPD
jgi:tripartite-type tricarboxylate transporter receptor subunit TctC